MNRYLTFSLAALEMFFFSSIAAATNIEFRAIEFKPNHPVKGESISYAVKEPSKTSLQMLRNNLYLINKVNPSRVEVVGFTDSSECSGNECNELSIRRAKSVYDWLIGQGVPPNRLKGPEGRGRDMPIDDNRTVKGRQRNRRTEMNLL